ncbi:MAG: hypothetical protein ACLPN1_13940 [Dissulfurispiraceae bacterium]
MVLPHLGLLSMGITALCIGTVLSAKEHTNKRMFKCKKCGEMKMHTKRGQIFCKNGHRVKMDE